MLSIYPATVNMFRRSTLLHPHCIVCVFYQVPGQPGVRVVRPAHAHFRVVNAPQHQQHVQRQQQIRQQQLQQHQQRQQEGN